jgi:protein-disulfide isomerase
MTKWFTAAALALSLTTPFMAPAPAQAEMTEAERSDFRAEIRAYLLENPEVLMEAIAVLENRRDSAATADDIALLETHADAIYNDPASWSGGNPDGDITVVEFMDYRCSYCRKAHDEVAELVASDGNIRLVLKEFPILGEQSDLLSRFAIAVLQLEGADAYKSTHDALIFYHGTVTLPGLQKLGGDLGLADVDAVMARMASPEVQSVIDANHELGTLMSISGTPTFVVDQTMVRGYVPLDGMRQIVEGQRKG